MQRLNMESIYIKCLRIVLLVFAFQKAFFQNQYNMLLSMKNTLSTDIEQKVREAYSSFAFDGAISSLMLQEAANFEKSKNVKRTETLVATLQTVESYSDISNPVDLVNFLKIGLLNF